MAGLNHAMHMEKTVAEPDPPVEDDFWTKFINFISGGAIDEARAILAFEATNPSFADKIIFRTSIALNNSTSETFLAGNLGAYGNYRGLRTFGKSFSVKSIINNAGKLQRLSGGVKQGFINDSGQKLFNNMAKQYNAKIYLDSKKGHQYFSSGSLRVDFTSSSRDIPTLRINDNGNLYKIRTK